ncbi:PilN domain-containing protein [Rubinisphaera italica]|uniref:Fimbrial assembly protein (PilN) n=1 Tax=Rubinisphaera italica TaxID=2527969 RepID=A0A5C5XBX6_9PLAN|nr:PilN domain-containing protein [Rubinisphaera italica]TWT59931.1 Fimbrial assembly protein (PilN) [Rubinisphaera italica]
MSGFKRLNLVPLSTQFELILRSQLRRWVKTIGFVICGLAIIILWQVSELHVSTVVLHQKEMRYQPVRDMMSQNSKISQQLKEIEQQKTQLKNLVSGPTPLHILKAIAVASHHASGQVVVTSLSCNSQDVQEQQPAKSTNVSNVSRKCKRIGTVAMAGNGEDDEAIMEFISALKSSGLFNKVELKSATHTKDQNHTTKQFHIEAISETEVAS